MSTVPPDWITVYHVKDGPKTLAPIDAKYAVNEHPTEWSDEPWPTVAVDGEVEIPADWHNLTVAKRRAIAMQLGAPNTVKVKEAEKMIEDELARRAKAKPKDE